jgi:hypothetical protein
MELECNVTDLEELFPLDKNINNTRIKLIWELQVERGTVLYNIKHNNYSKFLISEIKREKLLDESRSIQSEVIEYLFIDNSYNDLLLVFIPHLDIDLIESKVEYEMMINKNISCIPNIISNFYNNNELNNIFESLMINK